MKRNKELACRQKIICTYHLNKRYQSLLDCYVKKRHMSYMTVWWMVRHYKEYCAALPVLNNQIKKMCGMLIQLGVEANRTEEIFSMLVGVEANRTEEIFSMLGGLKNGAIDRKAGRPLLLPVLF